MDFHVSRGVVILFGGKGPTDVVDDTWFWDGAAWSDHTANFDDPTARTGARFAYDASNASLLLFGGCTSGCGPLETQVATVVHETYTLDGGDYMLWNNAAPPARCCVGMAFFAGTTNKIFLFGGNNDTQTFGDLWQWNFSTKKWACLQGCPNK